MYFLYFILQSTNSYTGDDANFVCQEIMSMNFRNFITFVQLLEALGPTTKLESRRIQKLAMSFKKTFKDTLILQLLVVIKFHIRF